MTTFAHAPSSRLQAALTPPDRVAPHRLINWIKEVFQPSTNITHLRNLPEHVQRDIGLSDGDIAWLRDQPSSTLIR